jgi:protein-ribulosamine 3-kinase
MQAWSDLVQKLDNQHGIRLLGKRARSVSGGDIHRAHRVESESGPLFIKTNTDLHLDHFQAEFAGLQALAANGALRVPQALACGLAGETAYLVLEWLDLVSPDRDSATRMGQGLAALHQSTADCFGFPGDNYIGRTPQPNSFSRNWADFFREHRLGFQLDLAIANGFQFLRGDGQRLVRDLDALFVGYEPAPSLLHGDLWGGNWAALDTGEPVIFDPAVYYGDRETDLAMTRLFGGFGETFYTAYEAMWPMSEGWQGRCELYQLYHVLNHANLFGAGYARDAQQRIKCLLAKLC